MTKKSNFGSANSIHEDVLRLLDINKKIAKLYRKAGKLEFRNGFHEEAGKNLIKAAELYPEIKKSISFNGETLSIENDEDNNDAKDVLYKLFFDHMSDEPDLISGILNRIMEDARINAIKNFDFTGVGNLKPYTGKDFKFPEYATLFAFPFPQDDEDLIEFCIEDDLNDINTIMNLLDKKSKPEKVNAAKEDPKKDPIMNTLKAINGYLKETEYVAEKEKAYKKNVDEKGKAWDNNAVDGWNELLKILEGNEYIYTDVKLPFNDPAEKPVIIPVTADGEKVINATANNDATKKQKKGIKEVIDNAPLKTGTNTKTIKCDCTKPSAIDKNLIEAMPDKKLSKQLENYMKAKKIVGTDIVTLDDVIAILSGRY